MKSHPKGKVSIKHLVSEKGEPQRYATQIKGMLESSGFEVGGAMLAFIVTSGDTEGVWLKVKSKDAVPAYAGLLQKAFEEIGIKVQATIEDVAYTMDDDMVVVYIYKKA